MALSATQITAIEQTFDDFMAKRRPTPEIRPKLDLTWELSGQSVLLFTVRPQWNDPAKQIKSGIAKATFEKTTALWKVYWMRADLKWHRYDPQPSVGNVEAFLKIVDQDRHGSFWG